MGLQLGERLFEEGEEGAQVGPRRLGMGLAIGGGSEQHPAEIPLARQHPEEGLVQGRDALERRKALDRDRLRDRLGQIRQALREDVGVERFLVLEVVVERALGDTCRLGDLVQGRLVVAPLGEDGERSGANLVLGHDGLSLN
ncbi:hypothetical protein D3C86_1576760 [compost metagenome]